MTDVLAFWHFIKAHSPWEISILALLFLLWLAVFRRPEFDLLVAFLLTPFQAFRWAQRLLVARTLEGKINASANSLNRECLDIAPYRLRIHWVDKLKAETFLEKDRVVVCMEHSRHNSRNLALAALQFVARSVIPSARRYMAPKVSRAIDLVTSKAILHSTDAIALDLFIKDVYEKETLADADLRDYCERVEAIDFKGLMTRVLLRELRGLGSLLEGKLPGGKEKEDSKKIIGFLYDIAAKPEHDQEAPLDWSGNFLRIGFVWIGRGSVISMHGTSPYEGRVSGKLASGVDSVYLYAIGGNSVREARKVYLKFAARHDVEAIGCSEYVATTPDGKRPSICFLLRRRRTSLGDNS